MDGVISQIRKSIKSFFREDKITFIAFIALPLIMTLIYGTMNSKTFNGKSNIESIKVNFIYDEDGSTGKILSSVLQEEQVKNFIESTSDGAGCEVTIEDNFNDIKIKNIKCSAMEMNVLTNFIKNFTSSVNQYEVVRKVAVTQINPEEREKLVNNILEKIQEIQEKPSVEEKILDGYKTLSSYEYYGISIFTFTSMTLLLTLINKFFNDKKQGIVNRSFAAPMSKLNYLIGYIISSSLLAFFINLVYVIICRVSSLSFKGNFFGIIIILFIQSLLQGAMAGTMVAFIRNKNIVNLIMAIFMILPATVGGVFYNFENSDIKVLKVLSNFSPNSLLLNAYKTISISNNISDASGYILCMGAILIGLIVVSAIKVSARWED
ncbi:ABC transporter permease [Clostridium sp. SHJSY1]|uniref:ABC transporter permease n=1 Tax=Clostridium sp. SHJSY1 TaxID=2942483 RepID=UPI002876A440|nr:ABC transporter permease [Clostridium sp. SHJSY1]MDS0525962.1 ABC transporter permease [Clostridium sp. SHJSY1]